MTDIVLRGTKASMKQTKALGPLQKKTVKKMIHRALDVAQEDKFFETDTTVAAGTAATNTTGTVTSLFNMAEGITENTRIARQVKIKYLQFHLGATSVQLTAVNPAVFDTHLRIIVFQDNGTNGTAPAVTDVIASAGVTVFDSLRNTIGLKQKRFRILYDRIMDLDPNVQTVSSVLFTSSTSQQSKTIKKYMKGAKVSYLSSAAAVPDKGGIFLLLLSNQGTATSPAFEMVTRICFEDA